MASFNPILIITIRIMVEEIDKIKDNPTTQRHIPTVKKSPPNEFPRYFNIICKFIPMNFPFKNEKASPSPIIGLITFVNL